MNLLTFSTLPPWAAAIVIAAHFAVGIGLGFLYFRAVWWNARLFATGGHAITAAALLAGRFVVLGGLFVLASREGALPLLAMALGVLVIRPAVMRSVREALP